jgi:hypothetical protein
MKNLFWALCVVAGVSFLSWNNPVMAEEAPKTRKVCLDVQGKDGKPVMDPKTNKPKQTCKDVKVHKKHEGTKLEGATKDKK